MDVEKDLLFWFVAAVVVIAGVVVVCRGTVGGSTDTHVGDSGSDVGGDD